MSESYSPNPSAEPDDVFETVFLSQRDLGLQIPINYVPVPGFSLTDACFSDGRYEDSRFGNCLANLLALQYRRIVVDLYWNQNSSVWSLCPVGLPLSSTVALNSTSISGATRPTSGLNTTSIAARQAITDSATTSAALPTTVSSNDVSATSALGSELPSISTPPDSLGGTVYTIGPFVCTETITLSALTSLLYDYIQKTQNNLAAHLLYVTLNIHAAASSTSPNGPALAPTSLPVSSDLLGTSFASNFSDYLYSPSDLYSERRNLNYSWYEVSEEYRPIESYYNISKSDDGIISTGNGWATEYYIEFSQRKRLVVDFGSVDPQMKNYSLTDDGDKIFGPNLLQSNQSQALVSEDSGLGSLCLIHGSSGSGHFNASWAIAATTNTSGFDSPTANLRPLLDLSSNLTACGISSLLNSTLLNTTADVDYVPFQSFSYSTIWSWAPGEPKNYTGRDADDDSFFRCATTLRDDLGGRWIVSDCSSKYFSACQANDQPFNWSISTYSVSYSYAPQSCPEGYTFAAPRTALENTFLNQTIASSERDYDNHGPWIDLNSLDEKGCWVANNGPNSTCPYKDSGQMEGLRTRYVLVPAIAAVIVLFLTALMVFGKLAGNKRVGKRTRKRKQDVYESIPA